MKRLKVARAEASRLTSFITKKKSEFHFYTENNEEFSLRKNIINDALFFIGVRTHNSQSFVITKSYLTLDPARLREPNITT